MCSLAVISEACDQATIFFLARKRSKHHPNLNVSGHGHACAKSGCEIACSGKIHIKAQQGWALCEAKMPICCLISCMCDHTLIAMTHILLLWLVVGLANRIQRHIGLCLFITLPGNKLKGKCELVWPCQGTNCPSWFREFTAKVQSPCIYCIPHINHKCSYHPHGPLISSGYWNHLNAQWNHQADHWNQKLPQGPQDLV